MKEKEKIVVLGAGESGVGAAILAKKKGFDVWVSDGGVINEKYRSELIKNKIAFEERNHTEAKILAAKEVIKSPGIPEKIAIIKKIRKKKIPVISEIEFAGRYTNAKMICITGTNGKTTTTLLTHHILKKAGLKVGLAGNVGTSLALQVAKKKFDYYVLELSSFQLDDMNEFKSDIAVLLNITPDHLDRYDYNFNNYVQSKFRIIQNQTKNDAFIYCMDDKVITDTLKKIKPKAHLYPFSIKKKLKEGAWLENDFINITTKNQTTTMSIYNLALQGKHNIYNGMAAGIAARILEVRKETVRESLSDFRNAEHRLEYVSTVHGVEFVNDSKATNVNSTWFALESFNKPVVLILGGVDKGNDYNMMKELVKQKVKAIVCLGMENRKIHRAFKDIAPIIIDTTSAKQAVHESLKLASKGDVVLLSPACASFDLFENYEDRGRQFKKAVKAL